METPVEEKASTEPPFIEFTGRRRSLFWLVLKNILLNIVTIGIFRFWGKTRVRRYFWGNIVIGGEPLEYTGRGLELFIGFLIVLAVLVPLSLVQSGLNLLVGLGMPFLAIGFNFVYFAVFLFLIQFALFRMWRYRLTRTRWRGLRFGLDGSAFRYSVRAFLWMLFQGVTLGIASPWARVSLMRYKASRVRFGDTRFEFGGRGRDLLIPWLLATALPMVLWIIGFVALGSGLIDSAGGAPGAPLRPESLSWAVALLPAGGLLFAVTWIWYRVREFRYFAGCLKFGTCSFASNLRTRRILPVILLAGVLFIVLLGLIVGALALLFYFAGPGGPGFSGMEAFIPLLLILVAAIFSPLVVYPVVVFSIVRQVWTTLSVSDPAAFDAAARATGEAPRFGEGLADAFDVGAF